MAGARCTVIEVLGAQRGTRRKRRRNTRQRCGDDQADEPMSPRTHVSSIALSHKASRLSRRAFPITETELNVMAALAIIGLSNRPKAG